MRLGGWLFMATLLAPCAASAADGNLPLEAERTVEFVTERATWMSLDVSPDGATLVIDVLGDLYLLPAAGGTARPLTRGMAFDSQPVFSPDGERVAFVSDRGGAENVWVMNVDGSDPRRLSDNSAMAQFASPEWAPDGSHVVASRTTWALGTYELWAYHLEGGKGLRLTRARASSRTPMGQRHNSLGAAYDPHGRYLYYAYKLGGFGYNLQLPLWQIVRHDLRSGDRDRLTQAQGSAFRPRLSHDGRTLVYATRFEQSTGLRPRDLDTGEDRWLVYPVEHDDQESRFTRDLLPGYAFTADGRELLFTRDGGIARLDLASGAVTRVPFEVPVAQPLGPRLSFPYRLGLGPVKARLIRDPVMSPDGERLAFSAFTRVHAYDFASGRLTPLTPEGVAAFHPAFSPDGQWLAYVTWDTGGGHIWRMRADGSGVPERLTEVPAYYSDPAFSADGQRLAALRASSYERLYRERDLGAPVGSDVVWLPAGGGTAHLVMPSRGYARPHRGPEDDRLYLYQNNGSQAALISLRYDGSDRRRLLAAEGPGLPFDQGDAAADDIRLSPDGRHALIAHANQLYLAALINPQLAGLDISLTDPPVPLTRLTDVGADYFGWGPGGTIYWSTGNRFYTRDPASVVFSDDAEAAGAERDDSAAATEPAAGQNGQAMRESHEAVRSTEIAVYRPRHVPEGRIALEGATVLPMTGGAAVIDDAVVLVEGDRIRAVGPRDAVEIPADARRLDVSGRYILPGFIDTHAHFRPLRRVLDTDNWAFLANLAYGVTTGLDVQPVTTDILSYQDLIDAGLMTGPRALSTGPGLFSNNAFDSRRHTRAVLQRYKDSYRVHNLKAYLAGNREQRQWIAQAARELELMPTTEGALDMKLGLSHVIDGFSGHEHNFPMHTLHRDVVELVARSGIAYTPALLVNFGAPFAESYFYSRDNPHHDEKLRRFTPDNVLAARTLRGAWFHEDEYAFPQLAAQAARIVRAGGRVGVGSHGQLQGLGYHWELRALARGLSNRETLTAATRHGAEIIGVAQDIGTVEAGKLADLVVLAENPLEDIRHTGSIVYVMKNGELFAGDTLDQLHPVEQPLPDQWWWHTGPDS